MQVQGASSINSVTSSGNSALDYALERGDYDILDLLVRNNARPSLKWDKHSRNIPRWVDAVWFTELIAALDQPIEMSGFPTNRWRYDIKKTGGWLPVYRGTGTRAVAYVEINVPHGAENPVRRLKFVTTSRGQGLTDYSPFKGVWDGTYTGSETWFEARIKRPDGRSLPRRLI
jgi:ankyrin repeat protein